MAACPSQFPSLEGDSAARQRDTDCFGTRRSTVEYKRWTAAKGSCSLHELAQGITESYGALGAVLGKLMSVSKPDLAKELAPFPRSKLRFLFSRYPARTRVLNRFVARIRTTLFTRFFFNSLIITSAPLAWFFSTHKYCEVPLQIM